MRKTQEQRQQDLYEAAVGLRQHTGTEPVMALAKLLEAIQDTYTVDSVTADSLLYVQGANDQCALLLGLISPPADGEDHSFSDSTHVIPRVSSEWSAATTAAVAAKIAAQM